MTRMVVLAVRFLVVALVAVAPARAASPDSFADLAERVLPSVVNVSALPPSGVAGAEPRALGSGFVVDRDGLIVTNNHVIEDAANLVVIFGDDRSYPVTVRGRDVETDLAVLEITRPDRRFSPLSFGDSRSARVGDWVLAIGNPFGLGSSVSAGIISGQSRDIGAGLYDKFIQTDAAINRGNSGGPLFDRRGRVIGVNTVIFSQTGGSVGVGFAIPTEIAEPVIEQLIEKGRTTRGYLGAFLDDVDPATRREFGLALHEGALVTGIAVTDGPAAAAGLRSGDVILAFGGRQVRGRRALTQLIADAPIGEPIPVLVMRGGREERLSVTLVTRAQRLADIESETDADADVEMAGLRLRTVSNDLASRYDLPSDLKGVVVTGVAGHLGAATSLQPGDVILEIGWDAAESVEEMGAKLDQLRNARSGPVKILVRRGDRLFYETLRP